MTTTRLTFRLSSMIAGVPHQGGAAWAVLQYLLALKRLGHDVSLTEPVQEMVQVGVPLRGSGPSFCPYLPRCVEQTFLEVRTHDAG
jgi:hypothetical protein